jgi:hypothetical protein
MFTDMVGYTASIQSDEARTLELLREQEDLVRPMFLAYQGREVKSIGDGFLVEFDSTLQATRCALDIQRRLHERNASPGIAPIQIRIGIHLGDVEQRGSDIFGDAVNIAARIEPVADPGGVCVSGAVYEQVQNKIAEPLEKLPPRSLKGLSASMDIYRAVLPWMVPSHASPSSGTIRKGESLSSTRAESPQRPVAAAVVSITGGTVILGWGLLVAIVGASLLAAVSPSLAPYGRDVTAIGALEAVLGALVLVFGVLLYLRPRHHAVFGMLVLASSVVSVVGLGGLVVGLVLGVIGGAFGIAYRPTPAPRALQSVQPQG